MFNFTATTASTPSCCTSVSSSTSTGSPPNTAVAGASATSFETASDALSRTSFVNFYRHELPADWHVSAPVIQWQFDAPNDDALALVPRMETDVCLRGPGRAIILDTKFYAQALKVGAYGTRQTSVSQSVSTLHLPASAVHVNPAGSRPKASSFTRAPRATSPSNSPRTATVFARLTLDLAQPWQKIYASLMEIVVAEPPMLTVAQTVSPAAI